ncbi:MAG: ATP-dependent DNA helicase [Nanoarchaeota archaeon]|nr:ATP-dependent DNA helicase [Nanoarchaeota archaeon]MBU1321308.1 ATP-dependent DNA helicase [Nanoarchaeota archaeon]MBU1597299.1 ATP-dependent DNA helicase [Nanoarchaeota archaeon]MBU2441586.1 ATP-dependent DNA helicase [Nanoarchaeota archaeon]
MVLGEEFKEVLFPHETVRPIQDELIRKINKTVTTQQNLIAHAPTGLGKTAAALGPGIKEAQKKDLTVFFLTSRHTQHKLAMETVNQIREKYKLNFTAVDIIGKKWMCLQPTVSKLYPREFSEYCKKLKEDDLCDFYTKMRDKGESSKQALELVMQLKRENKTDTESIVEKSKEHEMCPYEVSLLIAKDARVIIGDYYYLFNPHIRENFLKRTGKELNKIIIIIDEGHNLPERVKDLASHRISTNTIHRAIEEIKKKDKEEILQILELLRKKVFEMGKNVDDEIYLTKDLLISEINELTDYDEMVSEMLVTADIIREEDKQSSLGTIGAFLEAWQGDDKGFTRILSKSRGLRGEEILVVQYRCLDPSLITRDVIGSAYSTILMSGTLSPTSMYKELLGFDSADQESYKSPFPEKNKLSIIIPKTSTKYETRSEDQYREIAEIIARATNKIPGNTAVFFPSYNLRDEVEKYFSKLTDRTTFVEQQKMTKKEKMDFLEAFKGYKNVGAVLLGVVGGNFAEGIDLPGSFLKGVIIVGLPLQRPDLETQALIKYYDEKFKKGWDYGYLFPAFNRALQSAGRCIRSETDKGVIIFLDERYSWKNYSRCFPPSWDMKTTLLYESMIERFFEGH